MMKYQWIRSNYKVIIWARSISLYIYIYIREISNSILRLILCSKWIFIVMFFFFQNPTLGKVNIHGSLILQTLLEFKNPKYVVNSLLHMTPKNLQCLACDPSGSHIMEVYFKSTTVTEKNKAAMVDRLQVITIVYSWDIIYTVHIMLDKL